YLPAPIPIKNSPYPVGEAKAKLEQCYSLYNIKYINFEEYKIYPEKWYSYSVGMGIEGLKLTIFITPVKHIFEKNSIKYIKNCKVVVKYTVFKQRQIVDKYDLLILAPSILKDKVLPLALHKNETGIRTNIVLLDEIYSKMSGRDEQEKIKYFIKKAKEEWNIKYVLLIGDADLFPVRYADIPDGFDDDNSIFIDGRVVPTDLYYADIYNYLGSFCSWDGNGNNTFGEFGKDGVDIHPDVYVGRLPCSDVTEAERMVNKIINYELNTGGADWFKNVVFAATDTFDASYGDTSGVPEGEYTLDVASTHLPGFNIQKYYETKGTLSTSNIVTAINNGAGFLGLSDHGEYTGWGYTSAGGPFISIADASTLTNGYKLPIAIADACLTGGFDNENTTYNPYSSSDSLAEYFLKSSNGGAIAYIGATRVAYGALGTLYPSIFSGYIDVHLYIAYKNGKGTPGRMLACALEDYISNIGVNSVLGYKTLLEYNLFGDPSLALGGIDLNIKIDNETKGVNPGEKVTYNITVKNSGSSVLPVELKFSNPPANWSANLDSSYFILQKNEEKRIFLNVTAPKKAMPSETAIIEISAYSYATDRSSYIKTKTTVNEIFILEVSTSENSKELWGGESADFEVKLKNYGNIEKKIKISFISLPPNWKNLNPDEIKLMPYSETYENFTILVPINATSMQYNFSVLFSCKEVSKELNFSIFVKQFFELKLVNLDGLKKGYPNEKLEYNISVINSGNGREEIRFYAEALPPDWEFVFEKESMVLDAFSSSMNKLYINLPNNALFGEYEITIFANSLHGSAIEKINVFVEKVVGIEVFIEKKSTKLYPGETKEFIIKVENTGNSMQYVESEQKTNLSCAFSLNHKSIYIKPFSSSIFILKIITSPKAFAGKYEFEVILNCKENIKKNLKIEIEIEGVSKIQVSIPSKSYAVLPETTVTIPIELKNNGNKIENFKPKISLPSNWEYETSEIYIQPYEEKKIEAKIKVPSAYPGLYSLIFSTPSGEGKIFIYVLQRYEIELSAEYKYLSTNQSGILIYPIDVKNNGNGIDKILIKATGGKVEVSNDELVLQPYQSFRVYLTFIAENSTGIYNISFTALSEGGEEKEIYIVAEVIGEEKHTDIDKTIEKIKEKTIDWLYKLLIAVILIIVAGIIAFIARKKIRL
ncbi:MAG: C25 family cysteine peptidase, partial [Candidatus Thermoplasmatota archaeon]